METFFIHMLYHIVSVCISYFRTWVHYIVLMTLMSGHGSAHLWIRWEAEVSAAMAQQPGPSEVL